jgi:hypothetical protein
MCLTMIVYHAVCCQSMNKALEKDENRQTYLVSFLSYLDDRAYWTRETDKSRPNTLDNRMPLTHRQQVDDWNPAHCEARRSQPWGDMWPDLTDRTGDATGGYGSDRPGRPGSASLLLLGFREHSPSLDVHLAGPRSSACPRPE